MSAPMNLLLRCPDAPVRPHCYNRPPRPDGYTRYGIDSQTGERIAVRISNTWSEDKCATWDGVGIGQPTAKYPSGTPYPMAYGYDCRGCRWLPEEHREDAE